MSKSKKALQQEMLQGAAPVIEQEAVAADTAARSPVQAEAAENAETEPKNSVDKFQLVVLAIPGTEDLVRRMWNKFCSVKALVIPMLGGESVVSLLESIVAMDYVDRKFTLVPGNLVPLSHIESAELSFPRFYTNVRGDQSYWGRVPVAFDKEDLVKMLPDSDAVKDEVFVRNYVTATTQVRPELVGATVGNYLINVLRGTPCQNVVIEGFLRKRFLFANEVGWNAITDLIEQAFFSGK